MCLARGDVALEEHFRPAERRARFALRLFELGSQLVGPCDDAHPAAAAAEAGLDDERDSRSARPLPRRRRRLASACSVPGIVGTPACLREALRRGLVAERFELLGGRSDERDAGLLARARERRALGEEPVAGMDRVDAVLLGDRDERVDVQIRAHRLAAARRPDQERLIGLEAVQREAIFVAVDRDGAQTELGRGAEAADGDLGPVGDEQRFHGAVNDDLTGSQTAVRWAGKMAPHVAAPSDIVVVGAGIVGCAVAYELARRGASVQIVDDRPAGMGATQASAGMLAPYIEAREGHPLLELTVRSLDLFDKFVARRRRRSADRSRTAARARSTSRSMQTICAASRPRR